VKKCKWDQMFVLEDKRFCIGDGPSGEVLAATCPSERAFCPPVGRFVPLFYYLGGPAFILVVAITKRATVEAPPCRMEGAFPVAYFSLDPHLSQHHDSHSDCR
jgi:hypothetical protein